MAKVGRGRGRTSPSWFRPLTLALFLEEFVILFVRESRENLHSSKKAESALPWFGLTTIYDCNYQSQSQPRFKLISETCRFITKPSREVTRVQSSEFHAKQAFHPCGSPVSRQSAVLSETQSVSLIET